MVGWCCMCKQSGESFSFTMKWHKLLWSVLFSLFDVTWVMFGGVADLLICWRGQSGNISAKEVWQIAPLCLMWII